jgi:hypothetical protein
MLQAIDILLGLSVVMLVASMAVTVLTQFITSLSNSRGKHLARGLGDLLQQIDPQLERTIADQTAKAILTHPLIGHLKGLPLLGNKLGDTIHREEFTKLLMDLAAGNNFGLDKTQFPDEIKDKLKGLLKSNGIDDPASTLDKVRAYALQLEQANPELATDVRQNMALMQEANSRLIAKINSWFDQTIDRVSDRFTASTRVVTVLCSFVVVATVQLDTIDVINRLSLDDKLREQLVDRAFALEKTNYNFETKSPILNHTQPTSEIKAVENKQQSVDAPSEQSSGPQASFDVDQVRNNLKSLEDLGLINIVGRGKSGWWQHWREVSLIGILLSVVLVSLGAPFWYGTLKNLLKLRSTIAGKDDLQRQIRQSTQQVATGTQSTDSEPSITS